VDLGAIESDVRFDHAAADALAQRCRNAAQTIEGQAGSRASKVQTAKAEFRGYFSELFSTNAQTAAGDAQHLADRLRDVATAVDQLSQDAQEEQDRRQQAREWKQRQDDRNLLEEGRDWLFGGEDPPVGPPATQLNATVDTPRSTPRQTPAPGSGGGGGGTSSARPSDLRSFASGSAGLDDLIKHYPGALRNLFSTFEARCDWGSLSCEGVFRGFDTYLASNDEDVLWANTIAGAFEQAGGSGDVSSLSNASLMAALQAAGVDASRDQLVIDPPTALGSMPTTGYANDPVNTATGNFIEPELDLTFGARSQALEFRRMYNSFSEEVGAFGPGWSSVVEAGLELTDEAARLRLPDGRVVVFPRAGEGWDRASSEPMWLERSEDGFVVTDNAGGRWRVDAGGALVGVAYGPGTAVSLVRESGRLVRVQHERGHGYDLVWSGGLVVALRADDGREVSYEYDDLGRLVAVTGETGRRTYGWDEGSLILTVTDGDGVVEAENVYDEQRRVVRQRSQYGRVTRFAYLPGRVTEVSDVDGTRANTWIHDAKGRLIGVVDADGYRQSMSYDGRGNRVLVTERDGSSTVHEHDARGRRVRTVGPNGAETTFGYDDADRVVTVVAPDGGVTEMSYEGDERSPSLLVDPEGGRTRMTWERGLLTRVVDPEGVVLRMDYDEHGELVATTDAAGRTARIERDTAGRIVATVTPTGRRTELILSASGDVLERRDPAGATWTYTRTPAGRLESVTDPVGALTTVERGADGEPERSIDPLGRAMTRRVDVLGNVSSLEMPDGTAWQYVHDALSRLRTVVDPLGGRWEHEYDAAGALTTVTDPTGVSVSIDSRDSGRSKVVDDGFSSVLTQLDEMGRPVGRELPDGSSELYTYDRCGRVVEAVDAEGGLTVLRRDRAGRLVEVVDPTGATRRFEYDECGRLSVSVDALGGRTTLEYDGDGRVVRSTSPAGEVSWVEHDVCGRVTARHVPGRGTARWEYDVAGRVVRHRDAWTGARRFRYDAAGQLVEVVDGVGGVTRFEYDENGRCIRTIDPLGGVTTREFDALHRCTAVTDPLGRTMRGGFDGAGRQVWQEYADGTRFTWEFDGAGSQRTFAVDGAVVAETTYDPRRRTAKVVDHTGGQPVTHGWSWDRRGGLVERSREGDVVRWERDALGRAVALTTPNGESTRYERDASGRIVAMHHSSAGDARFVYDADGRLVQAAAAGVQQDWRREAGHVVEHSRTDGSVFERTTIQRDADGRIVTVDRGGRTTRFEHDDACRLVRVVTPEASTRYGYDAAGRLVREQVDEQVTEHEHDAAGQLLVSRTGAGEVRHTYDQQGRRVASEGPAGERRYTWTPRSTLSAISTGGVTTALHVDATGELVSVDGVELFWDEGRSRPVQVGGLPVVTVNGFTSVGDGWNPVGWRDARSTGEEPWASPHAVSAPAGVDVGPNGEVMVAGLEWMQARVYDPTTHGFLSVDPLPPVSGTGWSANPYAFAGNDPLHALDPTGLRPVTDEELQTYIAENTGHWEYVAAAGMVIAGGVLVATGVGGPLGGALIGAGLDVAIQKYQNGSVNWGAVAVGAIAGGVAGHALRGVTTFGNGVMNAMYRGAGEGFAGGLAQSAYTFATGAGPHTPGEFVQGLVINTFAGMATGATVHHLTPVDTPTTGNNGPNPNGAPPAGNGGAGGGAPDLPQALGAGRNADPGVSVFQRADGQYGTSVDPASRAADLGQDVTTVPGTENLTRGEARAVQQALIERQGGGYSGNNAISPNHDYYGDSVSWGENWLQQNGL
jgi:RHS repeat-associated protein